MTFTTNLRCIAVFVVACSIFVGTRADADVLEIDASGFHWIAGGPRPNFDTPAVEGGAPVAPPRALMQAAANVGPQAWSGHLNTLAAKYDLSPALIEALVWQESRWRPSAVSSAGAIGLAQLMPGTARALAVDPRDPMANLEGGARYLRMQLNAFDGDLERALAAYNAGPGRVIRAKGVPRIPETQAYVAAIMARLSDPVRR